MDNANQKVAALLSGGAAEPKERTILQSSQFAKKAVEDLRGGLELAQKEEERVISETAYAKELIDIIQAKLSETHNPGRNPLIFKSIEERKNREKSHLDLDLIDIGRLRTIVADDDSEDAKLEAAANALRTAEDNVWKAQDMLKI